MAKDSSIAKRHLAILLDEIVVKDKTATNTGSHAALASTLRVIEGGKDKMDQVPRLFMDWRAQRDSNS